MTDNKASAALDTSKTGAPGFYGKLATPSDEQLEQMKTVQAAQVQAQLDAHFKLAEHFGKLCSTLKSNGVAAGDVTSIAKLIVFGLNV